MVVCMRSGAETGLRPALFEQTGSVNPLAMRAPPMAEK